MEAVRATNSENRPEDRVTVYQSDCLDDIPATERWDLVVSNPPHWDGTEESYRGAATGDRAFDRAVEVVPEQGCSAAVGEVFRFPAIRSALLSFLHRFPMAELRGQVLNIPHGVAETAVALDDRSRLLAGLRAALE